MKLERKLEALTRLEWALGSIKDQDNADAEYRAGEPLEDWEIAYNQEMQDAKELVDKMIDDTLFEVRVMNLAAQYREHGFTYGASISAARKQLKGMK